MRSFSGSVHPRSLLEDFVISSLHFSLINSNTEALRPDDNSVGIFIPKDTTGYINNTREDYNFKFNKLLGPETKQEEVFDGVAKEVRSIISRIDRSCSEFLGH